MSAAHPMTSLVSRPTVDAALRGIDFVAGRAREVLDGLVGLARQDGALALRLGMVLAWVKRQDLTVLGYSSFTAFCRERVGWTNSWMRDVVRLVESPLDLVKAAVCRDLLPLRVAVKAPGRVAVADQAAWLLDPTFEERPPTPLERFDGDDAEVIGRARRLARLCLGRSASLRELDAYVLKCFAERIPEAEILAAARERPARPTFEEVDWGWCTDGAPAEALLGAWAEPASVADAVAQIEAIEAVRRGRAAVLARTWAVADHHALWSLAGFDSGWDFAKEVLGWSRRTTQRNRRIGWALEWYPALDDAVADGLDVGAVALLAGVVGPHTVDRWVVVARRIGRVELSKAVRAAAHDRHTLDRYERALAEVDAWAAPSAGGPAEARVVLPAPDARPPREVRGPKGLAEAARWFVDHVRIPPQRGFGRVKERDGYRCQNPECGRVSLRSEAHHLYPRSQGGSDDEENGVTVCRPCHLRGLHTGDRRIEVERVVLPSGVKALVWRYAGGRVIVTLGEPGAQAETRR